MEEAGSDGVPGVPLGGAAAASLSLQRDHARQGQGRPPTAVTGSHRRGGHEAEGNAQEEPDPLAAALLPPPETGRSNGVVAARDLKLPMPPDMEPVYLIKLCRLRIMSESIQEKETPPPKTSRSDSATAMRV